MMQAKDLLQHGYRYAYSLTQKPHDAEDLVQEAWLKLTASKGHVANKSLLFVTIRNLYIDQYRHKNLIVIDSLENSQEPEAQEKLAQNVEDSRDISQAFKQLRPEENEAIFLNIVMGYTALEISDLTNKSRNTVLSLISRGKKRLLNILSTDNAKGGNEKKHETSR